MVPSGAVPEKFHWGGGAVANNLNFYVESAETADRECPINNGFGCTKNWLI